MKTKHLFFAAALSLLAACQVELQDNNLLETVENEKEQEEKVIPPEVTASQEVNTPTKSILEVDETGHGDIFWTPYDEINVFYGTTSTHYVSKNTENAATAVFKTSDVIGISETASENIWGLYPYNENATCTGSAVNTTLPATQFGVPGTFDDDLFITLAHNTSTALMFYNVCGGIKFSLSRNDITQITFRGNNDEDIAGDISLDFVDGLPSVDITSGEKEITLTPKTGSTFASGEYYYLILRPVTLENGFTMTFETTGGHYGVFEYTTSAVSIKRSKFGKKDEIDSYAVFSIPNNQIWYTSNGGVIVNPNMPQNIDATIVSNEYTDGKGVIVFDKNISSLGSAAFRGCDLSSIIIPNSVTSVGAQAFYNCSQLETITFSENTEVIGDYAFCYCSELQDIIVPMGVTNIGSCAFSYCTNLQTITLPAALNTLGQAAFSNCTSLEEIIIPAGLNDIDNNLFYGCSSLQSVIIPSGVVSIGTGVFSGCSSLDNLSIPIGVNSIGANAFYGCSTLQSITIPEGVTSIESSTFEDCSNLQYVSIPSGVTTIKSYAFKSCYNLQMVTIPVGVTSVGNSAFRGCSNLQSITIPAGVTSISSNLFAGCENLSTIILPNGITSIGEWAFSTCTSLNSISLPAGLTSIGNYAFTNCTSLESISLPSELTSVGKYAFQGCSSLEYISFPGGITSIAEGTFNNCTNLKAFTIPVGVTSIGGYAFNYCQSLSTITIPANVTSIGTRAFVMSGHDGITVLATTPPQGASNMFNSITIIGGIPSYYIYVPAGSVSSYKAASYWSNYSPAIVAIVQ